MPVPTDRRFPAPLDASASGRGSYPIPLLGSSGFTPDSLSARPRGRANEQDVHNVALGALSIAARTGFFARLLNRVPRGDPRVMWRVYGWVLGFLLVTVACGGEEDDTHGIGKPCITADESNETFSGFSNNEVSIETRGGNCGTGVCLVNHFKGRVSCPYGQSESDLELSCLLPGTSRPVLVPVEPQDSRRRADVAVTCSCRCAGPGTGPFCNCPDGSECAAVVDNLGLPGSDQLAGSYCIPQGTRFTGLEGPQCSPNILNCGPR
jgi:hypothetical protein